MYYYGTMVHNTRYSHGDYPVIATVLLRYTIPGRRERLQIIFVTHM